MAVLEDDVFPGADLVKYFEWGAQVMDTPLACYLATTGNGHAFWPVTV